MKLLKKMLSVFLTAAIMVSMVCIGTVSAGAAESDYSMTLDGSIDEFTITFKAPNGSPLHKMYSSESMYFVLIFTCEKQNVLILVNSVKGYLSTDDYAIYSSGSWQTAPQVNPKSRSTSIGYDYESYRSATGTDEPDFKAEFTLKDETFNKLLKTCSKVELGFESYSATTFAPEFETIWTKTTSKTKISSLEISDLKNYTYTGKNRKAAVTIKDGDYTLVKGTDYTLTYKNCKNIGTATVTIKGKGKYTGTKTLTYKIVPKKTTLTAKKSSDTKIKLSWTAVDGAEKYQIYYSTNNGKSYKKLATVSGDKTSVTISKLDFEKNDYKFKIRSYKTVDGKKYYSSFSKAITIK